MLNPIVLGSGRTLFDGVTGNVGLTLERSHNFKNGNIVLGYRP